MEIATIQGAARTTGGRHNNERLRRGGLLPAVIYGHGQPPLHVSLSRHDMDLALERMARVVKLQIDGREEQYLLKDVQYDHLQREPLHVDLMRVDVNERVKVKVPVQLRGRPKGAAEGGTLMHVLTDLEVECLLLQIPDNLRANVAELGLNDALYVKDIELPPNVTVLHAPDELVVIVHPPRGEETAVVAEAGAVPAEGAGVEPQVIGRGPKDKEVGADAAGE